MSLITELRTKSANTEELLNKQKEKISKSMHRAAERGEWLYSLSDIEMTGNKEAILDWLRGQGFIVTEHPFNGHNVSWSEPKNRDNFIVYLYDSINQSRTFLQKSTFIETHGFTSDVVQGAFQELTEKGYTVGPHTEQNGFGGNVISWG